MAIPKIHVLLVSKVNLPQVGNHTIWIYSKIISCHHLKLMKYKVDVCLLHLQYPHSWQYYEYSKTTFVFCCQLTLWTSQNKQSALDHHFKACNPMLSIWYISCIGWGYLTIPAHLPTRATSRWFSHELSISEQLKA